jgi:hypothetical protein
LEIVEFTRAKRVRISGQHRHHHFTTFLLDGIDFGLAATSSNVEQRKRQQLFSFVPRLGRFCGGACHNNKSNFHFFLFMVGKAKVDRQRAATGLDWTGLQGIGDFQAFFMCIFG